MELCGFKWNFNYRTDIEISIISFFGYWTRKVRFWGENQNWFHWIVGQKYLFCGLWEFWGHLKYNNMRIRLVGRGLRNMFWALIAVKVGERKSVTLVGEFIIIVVKYSPYDICNNLGDSTLILFTMHISSSIKFVLTESERNVMRRFVIYHFVFCLQFWY